MSVMQRIFNEHPELARMWGDIEGGRRELIAEAARRDPKKYAGTKVMAGHANYRYWKGGRVATGKTRHDVVSFCYSTGRNAAGNFLLWRETKRFRNGNLFEVARDEWGFSESRAEARSVEKRRADKWRAETKDGDR